MTNRPNLRLEGLAKHRNALAACFRDQQLCVDRFPDSHVLIARESSVAASVSDTRLSANDFACDLAVVAEQLDSLACDAPRFLFYINFPDNLADVLRHFIPVESSDEIFGCLSLFSQFPADEGGSSALGLFCPDEWVFCIDTTEFCDLDIVFAGRTDAVNKLSALS